MKSFIRASQLVRLFFIMSIGMMVMSCSFVNGHSIAGSGNVVKQDRQVASFHQLKTSIPLNIVLIPSNQYRVVVEIDDNLQQYIAVANEGSLLDISMTKHVNFSWRVKGQVFVYVDSLTALYNHSVGNITMLDTLHVPSFKLENHAVGKTTLNIDARSVIIKNHAVGNTQLAIIADSLLLEDHAVGETELTGTCNDAVLQNHSVGNFNAQQFICQTVHITNSAVGNTKITAEKAFYISNSGVGSLTLYGKGAVLSLHDSGLSKTHRADN